MARLTDLSRSVSGARVVVTGAASGMGRATAHLFADEGAIVVVTDVAVEGVLRVVDEIETVLDKKEGLLVSGGTNWYADLALI